MTGFGFMVARFALWLRAFTVASRAEPQPAYHLSVWFGMALVLLGVLTNAIAATRHRRYLCDLNAGNADPELRPMLGITIALVLASLGSRWLRISPSAESDR
jgi:uncharacterized membrane protein YidH (DUF202 family)